MKPRLLVAAITLLLPLLSMASEQQAQEEPQARSPWEPRTAWVPLMFSSNAMGFSAGVGGSLQGLGQPQAQVMGVGLLSTNGSHIGYLGAYNYKLSKDSRWYFDVDMFSSQQKYPLVYVDGNADFSGAAGGHDSNVDDYVEGLEEQFDIRLTARYILPFGAGKTAGRNKAQQVVNGLPVWPEGVKAPYPEALSSLHFRPFYLSRYVPDAVVSQQDTETMGLQIRFDHDARDFLPSPTRGHRLTVDLHKDWGGGSRSEYSKWEAQYSQYLDIGATSWAKQNTLALTAYMSDIPSWNDGERPPWFAESTLGGWKRMRGYASNRFHDRSAIYYGAEYRFIPEYQPQSDIPFLNWYNFPWYQVAAFVEAGRVADDFDLGTLHQDMNWDAGVGIRMWVERVLIRVDMATSGEGGQFRIVLNQAF